ncbi:hypothetical protein HYFRA_00008129 [Hymenoscyphus fraxineus]|uniref:Heterokaryon incompatibility domain-containing protein n=1 Tax=Hymenoscyphus fraxineus TaxID=746836 RepID=A0A9N9PUM0_9HELO|nr:hypothetical protein HYFRA_00008129 [Hymenoscyphus fraxineus]
MDHLPRPESSIGLLMEVPFVAKIPWDNGDFKTFPSRHGFPQNSEGAIDTNNHSIESLCDLMQSWLYFGFLECLLGQKVDRDSFVRTPRDSEGRTRLLVDSTPLDSLINRLEAERKKDLGRLPLLDEVWTVTKQLETQLEPIADTTVAEIAFSLRVLYRTCARFSFRLDNKKKSFEMKGCSGIGATNLLQRMKAAGWCDAELSSLCLKNTEIELFYFSQLPRPNTAGITHDNCTKLQCKANNVNQGNYINRHVKDGCSCKMIHVPHEELVGILRNGRIPVVQIVETCQGNIKLKVKPAQASTEYTAISHVWSDGLGNPISNSLHHCQLEHLSKSLRLIRSDRIWAPIQRTQKDFFWMDTLCIPPGNEYNELKMASINKMACIYAGAARVLVLDSGLQHIRMRNSHMIENLSHINHCAWKRRCWTLQEGALGQCTLFLFADGIVHVPVPGHPFSTYFSASKFPSLRKRIHRMVIHSPTSQSLLQYGIPRDLGNMRGVPAALYVHLDNSLRGLLQERWKYGFHRKRGFLTSLQELSCFVSVWNSLRNRTTTQIEDVVAILANLVDFDFSHISTLPPKKRLGSIILSLKHLPLSLLYNSGPRIDPTKVHPNRWIPTVPGPNLLDDEHTMTLDSGTLIISRAGDLPSKKPVEPLASAIISRLCGPLFGIRRTESTDQNGNFGPKTTRHLISIKPSTTSGRPLFLRVEPDLHNENLPKFIQIDFLRQRDDEMNSPDYAETLILIEDIPEPGIMEFSSGSWAGASFHSYGAPVSCDTEDSYEVIYDCPVRVAISTELSYLQTLYDKTQLDWDWIYPRARKTPSDFAPSPEPSHQLHRITAVQNLHDNPQNYDIEFIAKNWTLKSKCG